MSKLKKAYGKFLGGVTSPFGIKANTTAKDYSLSDSMAAGQKRRGGPPPSPVVASSPKPRPRRP